MRRLLVLATFLIMASSVALALFPGWSEEDEPGIGAARLEPAGRVWVTERGEPPRLAADTENLESGTRVEVQEGRATLRMADNIVLRVRRGSEIEIGRRPILQSGDLLVVSPDVPLTVITAGALGRVERGAARLSRTHAFEVGVYRGTAQVSSVGRFVPGGVPALRQAVVPAPGLVPAVPTALRLGDPWDDEFDEIVRAAALSRDLDAFSRGITSQLREGEGRTVGFYRLLLPDLDRTPAFTAERFGPLLEQRTPGENVVGAAIAIEGDQGEFVDRWTRVFSFRADGAAWGLVALDQGVDRGPVLDDLSLAAGALQVGTPGVVAAPPPPEPAPVAPAVPEVPPSTPPPAAPRVEGGPEPPLPTGSVPVPVLPDPPPTGVAVIDDTVDPLVDTVGGLLNEVAQTLGLVGAPPPSSPAAASDATASAAPAGGTTTAPLLRLG